MKKIIVLAFLLISTSFLGAEDLRKTISVSGEATYDIAPDIVYCNIGIERDGINAEEAQDVLKRSVAQVLEALNKNGLERENIKTDIYTVYPVYKQKKLNDSEVVEEIVKYRAYVRILVELNQITKLGAVIDSVIKAGSNKIENINFSVKNKEQAKNEAIRLAMAQAKEKASLLAGGFSMELLTPVSITESSGYMDNPQYRGFSAMSMSDNSNITLPSGLISIKSRVDVVYEMTKREIAEKL